MNFNYLNFNESLEEWRDIEGYEGLYMVSNYSRVKSVERIVTDNNGKYNNRIRVFKEHILKPHKNNKGYLHYQLSKDGVVKHHFAHRLVAKAFIPNPDNLPFINHKDENPLNNNVSNLEWCTEKYNSNYGTIKERLSIANGYVVGQYDMDMNLIRTFHSAIEAERYFGSKGCGSISQCCRNKPKYKTAYGYKWKYLPKEGSEN